MRQLSNALKQRLGAGEAEAIAFCIELNRDFVILDDKVARREAERMGLRVKGALGIILKLKQEKLITSIDYEELYHRLRECDFRIKKDIFNKIFISEDN